MNVVQQIESTAYLSPKHKSHIESRGLLNSWSYANCRTVSAEEASFYLGYTAKSGGILFVGNTTQFQFRPDKPWKSESCKKAPKYRTPVGEYDAFLPQHPTDKNYWDTENLKQHCYRINDHPCIVLTEGPFKGIAGCANGIPTIALLGVSMGLTSKKGDIQGKRYLVETLEKYARAGFGFIFAFDADAATNPNVNWEQRKLGSQLLKFSVPVYSITGVWDVGTEGETKGMDDFIQKKGIEEFRRMLVKSVSFEDWESKTTDGDGPDLKQEFNQQALEFLFGDKPWICADNKLYFWTGTHYEYSPDSEQRPRIASYCNSFSVFKERKGLTFPFANPASAKQVLEWAKMRLEVNSDSFNPPGLNCTNGVLQLHWEAAAVRLAPTPRWELVDHTPDFRYTYKPIATYNPEAPTEDCDRLMEVLSAPQRDIFLKTIAASLDLETVRKYKGRMVRALLLKGYGSNGKDTLREIVSLMYGRIGMTAATLSDFASYDEGRKFPLARTANSRVNWASENAQTARLDKIQSLKAFITGDTLSREGKGKDEEDFTPKAIAVFNCNDTPNMQGSLEAIKSRYGVLSFDKTFKIKADPTRGEIEADPRFKYDPDFLKAEVLPAFLNKVLDALVALMSDGIDYAATEAAMAAIQAENSHLFQFSQDTGLNYSPDDTLTASDIWTQLETWYQDNGTLVYETTSSDKVKAVWLDQPRRGDSNVKGINQALARIQQLFPKATRTTLYNATSKRSVAALSGIGFNDTRTSSAPVPHYYPHQETLTNQDLRTTRTSFSDSEQNQKKLEEDVGLETDNHNVCLENFTAKTVKPVESGAGGAEASEIKDSTCSIGAGTGAGEVETGAGEVEVPIAARVNWFIGDRVKVSAQYPGAQEYRGEGATVVEVWSDGLCRIELDREVVILGQSKKQLNLDGRYLVS
ncbi:DUF3854 domain-containing protein [Microcoleus sp. B4-D4]|uniref:DUF3854 domain-containing protein n=1 Tax=Microcoleus sp. B4-D4 TaxID=2818667 RepID=UPI002FD71C99